MGVAAGERDAVNQVEAFHVALDPAAKGRAGPLGQLETEGDEGAEGWRGWGEKTSNKNIYSLLGTRHA